MDKVTRLSLVFIGMVYFLSLAGCDLLGTDDNLDHSPRDPLIPYATSLSDGLPSRTDSKVIATIPASELGTFDVILTAIPEISCFTDISSSDYNDLLFIDYSIILGCVVGSDFPDNINVGFVNNDFSNYTGTIKNPILQRPVYLQFSYYYILVAQCQITQNSSKTIEESWTYGVDVEKAQSFTNTWGASATVTVGSDWKAFSAEASATVSQEFSSTYTSSTTISESKEYSESETFAPTGDGTYLYGVWQRVEVFQYVDADGNPWDISGLGYDIAEDPDSNDGIFGFESKLSKSVYEIVTYDVFH